MIPCNVLLWALAALGGHPARHPIALTPPPLQSVPNGAERPCKGGRKKIKKHWTALCVGWEATAHEHAELGFAAADTATERAASAGFGRRNPRCRTDRTEKLGDPVASELFGGVYITMSHRLFHFKYCLNLRGIVAVWLWWSKNVKECVPWGLMQYTENLSKKAAVLLNDTHFHPEHFYYRWN